MRASLAIVLAPALVAGALAGCAAPAGPDGQASVPAAPIELAGTTWQAVDIAGEAPVGQSAVTLHFLEENRVAGSAGCNRYAGQYRQDGEVLEFAPNMISTKMACAVEAMDQETRYLSLLPQVRSQRVEADGSLVLETGDGQALRFDAER